MALANTKTDIMMEEAKNKKITVTNPTEYHHMPDGANRWDLKGLTLRQALQALRNESWGSMGGTHRIELSDGTYMDVDLAPSIEGARLMNSQRVTRYSYDTRDGERVIRRYGL